MTLVSERSKPLLHRIWKTAILVGSVAGLMCGLARSPVAGVAIPGVLGLAAAAVNLGAERTAILKLRWWLFSAFAVPFMTFFVLALLAGVWLNHLQPSALQRYADSMKSFGLTQQQIADSLAKMVSESPDALRSFDDGWIWYNAPDTPIATSPSTSQINQQACDDLRPPAQGYASHAYFDQFKHAGEPFSKIAEFVASQHMEGMENGDQVKLLMLAAAHYGACGP